MTSVGDRGLFLMFSICSSSSSIVNPASFAVKIGDGQAPYPERTASESDAAETTARILLETEAVLFQPDNPFTFTSGRLSPVYVDCRRLISFPRARRKLMDMGAELIERRVGCESLDAIAGGETAGIPFAAWIADRLSLPMLYVRKQAKGFGRNAQIEGELKDEARVLLVEDLASEGTSKLNFVRAIRQAGGEIPYLRDLQLRHLPAYRIEPRRRGHHAARARHLVGRRGDRRKARALPGRGIRQDQKLSSKIPENWPAKTARRAAR
jgi:orotate phosphoribosyltransferase